MTNLRDLKTIGFTAFCYHDNQALFRINRGADYPSAPPRFGSAPYRQSSSLGRRHGSRL